MGLLTFKNPETLLFTKSSCTIELYDLHPLSFHVLTYEAETLLLKVMLQLRVHLHRDNTKLNKYTHSTVSEVVCKRSTYLKSMSVPLVHIFCVSIKFPWNTK